jgi:predicted nucleic acid-binding protein
MTTSIDTNIIVALWLKSDPLNRTAAELLERAHEAGELVISAPVFAELMGDPARNEAELSAFLVDTGVSVDWIMPEAAWREAGRAFQGYIRRRRSGAGALPRHILTDFLIGAHAMVHGYRLLTFDRRLYAAAFPALTIVAK